MRINTISKVVLLTIAMLAVAALLFSCSTDKPPLPLPDFNNDFDKPSPPPPVVDKIHIYYATTHSMFGFVNGDESDMYLFMEAVTSANSLIKPSGDRSADVQYYHLDGEKRENKEIRWERIDAPSFYKKEEYYTINYSKERFLGNTGPLQLLFEEDAGFNRDNLNVIVTNLVEQNNELQRGGNNFFREVVSQDGYMCALIAMNATFSGDLNVVDPYRVDRNGGNIYIKEEYTGRTLVYAIVSGPKKQVMMYANHLCSFIKEKNEGAYRQAEAFGREDNLENDVFSFTRADLSLSGGILSKPIDYSLDKHTSASKEITFNSAYIMDPIYLKNNMDLIDKYLSLQSISSSLNVKLLGDGTVSNTYKSGFFPSGSDVFLFKHKSFYNKDKFKDISVINFTVPLEIDEYTDPKNLSETILNNVRDVVSVPSVYVCPKSESAYQKISNEAVSKLIQNGTIKVEVFLRDSGGTIIAKNGVFESIPSSQENNSTKEETYNDIVCYNQWLPGGEGLSLQVRVIIKNMNELYDAVKDAFKGTSPTVSIESAAPIIFYVPVKFALSYEKKGDPSPGWVRALSANGVLEDINERTTHTIYFREFYNAMIGYGENGNGTITLANIAFATVK